MYVRDGLPYLLEVTLSIRNTDPQNSITITHADYYDDESYYADTLLTRCN